MVEGEEFREGVLPGGAGGGDGVEERADRDELGVVGVACLAEEAGGGVLGVGVGDVPDRGGVEEDAVGFDVEGL